jgi:hypothetical protein
MGSAMLRERWKSWVFFAAWSAAAGLALANVPANSKGSSSWRKPEEFKTALKMQNQGAWQESIPLIERAILTQDEDGERVKIKGSDIRYYVPHYYLGLAWYRLGDYGKALKEWDRSLAFGKIQDTDEYRSFSAYYTDCQAKLR